MTGCSTSLPSLTLSQQPNCVEIAQRLKWVVQRHMPTKSHIDLCLFLPILEIDGNQITQATKAVLKTRNQVAIANAFAKLDGDKALERLLDTPTALHESIHVVQAIVYPFLYWYSTLALRWVMQVFFNVNSARTDLIFDDRGEPTLPIFHVLSVPFYVYDTSRPIFGFNYKPQMEIHPAAPGTNSNARKLIFQFRLLDLIENAASLMQYKLQSRADFPTWKEYIRWSKRNPAYTDVLEAVGDFISNQDLAVRIFLSLVQVSFETNQPQQAFVTLLGALKINLIRGHLEDFVAQPEPCRWIELFERYLSMGNFDEADLNSLSADKYFRLDRNNVSNMTIHTALRHPILGGAMKLSRELEAKNHFLRHALTAPNGYARTMRQIQSIFQSHLSIIKFSIDGENIVSVVGDPFQSGLANSDIAATQTDIGALLVDFLAMYSYVRRRFSGLYDRDYRLCHHTECPLYANNFCNLWCFIPSDYNDCTFTSRLLEIWRGGAEWAAKTHGQHNGQSK